MRARALFITACTLTTVCVATGAAQDVAVARSPVTVSSATVTIEGTSKKDPFFASTKTVRVTRLQLAGPRSADVLQQVLQPGVAEHIHESLEADLHPEVRFQLRSITPASRDAAGFVRLTADGTLTVAGVARDVTLDINVTRAGDWRLLDGNTDLLMTDFGVRPPQGLLGMLRTDPLIRVRFYVMLRATERE